MDGNKDNNLGKSTTDAKCISKCYPGATVVYHPDTLQQVTDRDPFCLTKEWTSYNGEHRRISKCINPIKKIESFNKSLFLTPKLEFTYSDLLQIYGIKTFNGAIEYITDNHFLPMNTKNRIMNCVWHMFGNKIYAADEYIIEFYLEFTNTYWFRSLYNEVSPYLTVDKHDKVHITKEFDMSDDKKTKELKSKYIKRKMITGKIMLESLLNVEDYIKENFDKVEDFQVLIYEYFVNHIMEKIKYSQ